MSEARIGSRLAVATALAAIALSTTSPVLAAKPKADSKDAQAGRIEQRALKAFDAGDVRAAIGTLQLALLKCEPPNGCSAATLARLHISLGAVRGLGSSDYVAAKKEFASALALDPNVQFSAADAPKLVATFDEAKAEASGAPPPTAALTPPPPSKPPEKPPEKSVSVSDLFGHDEPPPPKKDDPKTLEPTGPKTRRNWLSLKTAFDFSHLSDANVCSPGAPSSWFCTDEQRKPYSGSPQKNDDVSSGFGFSVARLVLGYERVFFDGLTVGGFAGYAFNFAPSADGRKKTALPLSLEARATYTFGDAPYFDDAPLVQPFAFVSLGAADFDTHVKIRVNEVPCQLTISAACQRDLNAYRLVGGAFATVGGGVRFHIEGRHALRAGLSATFVLSEGMFVASPELGYEFGL